MIENLIVSNLVKKFNRELAKNNKEGMKVTIKRLEQSYKEHEQDDLGLQLFFWLRGTKKLYETEL